MVEDAVALVGLVEVGEERGGEDAEAASPMPRAASRMLMSCRSGRWR